MTLTNLNSQKKHITITLLFVYTTLYFSQNMTNHLYYLCSVVEGQTAALKTVLDSE